MRKWLQKLRIEKELTQKEVAKLLGISQQYYSMIEQGERQRELTLLMAQKMSEVFGVPLAFFVRVEQGGEDYRSCCETTGTVREFAPEDSDGICHQNVESVSNIFLI